MWKKEKKQETQEVSPEKEEGRDLYEWAQALVCSVLAVVLLFTFVIRLIGVDGHSMVPTLQDGDRLLVLNAMLDNDYGYGDIVVLRKDTFLEEPIVKRVIATEGQTVDIDFVSGAVYVDGELLEEDYINEPTYVEEGTEFPLTVPEGSIFVMGDNRNHSSDSRSSDLGTVDTRYVIGKAVFLLFPGADEATGQRDFGRIGPIFRHGRQPKPLQRQPQQRPWHGGHPVCHRQGGVPAVSRRGRGHRAAGLRPHRPHCGDRLSHGDSFLRRIDWAPPAGAA